MKMVTRYIPIVIMVLLVAALSTSTVLADPGHGKGGHGKGGNNNTDSTSGITLNENPDAIGEYVSFTVSRDLVKKESSLASLWVANKCYVGGGLVSSQHQPVEWSRSGDGYAGLFYVGSLRGAECTAYVWMFPSSTKILKGASVTYAVN